MRLKFHPPRGIAAAVFCLCAFFADGDGARAQQDRVVAVVEGEQVYMSDVENAFQTLPREVRSRGLGALYNRIVERIIQQKIVIKRAREAKVQETEEAKRRVRVLENQVVHDMFLSDLVDERLDEDELRRQYDSWAAANPPAEEIRARHILVETEQEAREIIGLVTSGTPFSELAKTRSKGPSGVQGGDLGWFTKGRMVPEFERAAFALGPNQFTADPIKTQFGWHVILVEDKRTVPTPGYETVRPRLIEQIGAEMAFRIADELVRESDVQRYDMEGNPMPAPAPLPAQQ